MFYFSLEMIDLIVFQLSYLLIKQLKTIAHFLKIIERISKNMPCILQLQHLSSF